MKSSNKKGVLKQILIVALIIFFILVLLPIFSDQNTDLSFVNEPTDNSVYYLPVVSTTDIHGYFVDISSGTENTYQYRLGYIANIINDIRKEGDILLVDTGDLYQGEVLSGKLDGQPIRAYLDLMKYDALCLGNHEFDWGVENVTDHDATIGSYDLGPEIKGEGNIPILCWNLYDKENGEKVDFTKDYIIVSKKAQNENGDEKTLKVAVIGYINDYSSSISKKLIDDYEIKEEDINEIEKTAAKLEANNEADITVLICHVSPEDMNELVLPDSSIDLVVCGHSHKTDTGNLSNGVPYILAGSYGEYYATATLSIHDKEVNCIDQQIVSVMKNLNNLYDNELNDECLDDDVMEISKASINIIKESNPDLLEQLGYITTNLSNHKLEGSVGENIVTNWAASMLANCVGADVGIINSTGVRSEIILKKDENKHYITGADIYSMLPFNDNILEYKITYEQLLELCSQIRLNDHSYLGISGVTVNYKDGDSTKPVTLYLGNEKLYDNGWVVDKNKTVKVAVSSYVAEFDNLCFVNLSPVNKGVVENKSIIDYLRKNYAPDSEILVDTESHKHAK